MVLIFLMVVMMIWFVGYSSKVMGGEVDFII